MHLGPPGSLGTLSPSLVGLLSSSSLVVFFAAARAPNLAAAALVARAAGFLPLGLRRETTQVSFRKGGQVHGSPADF